MAEKDKLAELHDFLKYDVEVSFLDGDVIDVAMDVISKHIERIKELEKVNKDNYWIASDYKFENLKLEQQNKRYREAINYVISAKTTHYNSLENALEDIKFVINEALESDGK